MEEMTLEELIQHLAAYEEGVVRLIRSFLCVEYKRLLRRGDTVFVLSYNGSMATKVIPHHFSVDVSDVYEAVIPDSVTRLMQTSFIMSTITTIHLSQQLTHIGDSVFVYCCNLQRVILPQTLKHIGARAFRGCASLTSMLIPNSVQHIGHRAFQDCAKLVRVVLPKTITCIPEKMFMGCHSLANIGLPSSVTIIGDQAFMNCVRLERMVFPPHLHTICSEAFWGCGFRSLDLPVSGCHIALNAFGGCSRMERSTRLRFAQYSKFT